MRTSFWNNITNKHYWPKTGRSSEKQNMYQKQYSKPNWSKNKLQNFLPKDINKTSWTDNVQPNIKLNIKLSAETIKQINTNHVMKLGNSGKFWMCRWHADDMRMLSSWCADDMQMISLADLGGAWGTHAPPWASKFFRFHAVFGKIWRVHAPPGGFTPPPRENPGSATGYVDVVCMMYRWRADVICHPPVTTALHKAYRLPCYHFSKIMPNNRLTALFTNSLASQLPGFAWYYSFHWKMSHRMWMGAGGRNGLWRPFL